MSVGAVLGYKCSVLLFAYGENCEILLFLAVHMK